jgi:NADPH-dependent curcumin reductase CurA
MLLDYRLTISQNFTMIIAMRIKLEGFIVFDHAKQFPEARKELAQWLAEGKIQRKETIIKGGLPAAEQALLDLYKGVNTGKSASRFYLINATWT